MKIYGRTIDKSFHALIAHNEKTGRLSGPAFEEKQIDDGGISSSGKRKEMKRKSERNAAINKSVELFRKALIKGDTAGTREALALMSSLGKRRGFSSEDEKIIYGYSKFLDAEDNMRRGKGRRTFDILFNPYTGRAEEIFKLCSCLERDSDKAMILLLSGTENFLFAFSLYSPLFRKEAYPYLEKWLLELMELVPSHAGGFESGSSGSVALAFLMSALISDNHFSSVVERSFQLFPESIAEAEVSFAAPSSPLNTAVRTGDIDTFRKFYAMERVRKLICPEKRKDTECGIMKSRGKIYCYPEKSAGMLDHLFSLGLVLPGTVEGERAFFYTVMHLSPSREIIGKIKHPSYFKVSLSPLLSAVRNRDFSPENYDLLIENGCDISGSGPDSVDLPPLFYALESRDRRKTESLIKLGADISWHDRWDNNILHRLVARGWKPDEEDYGKLHSERNIYGRTPLEYASLPSMHTLLEMKRITFSDALDMVLSTPERRTYFFFEDGRLQPSGKIVGSVMEYLDGKPQLSDVVLGRIWTGDDLRHFWKAGADGKGRYLLFMDYGYLPGERLIRELEERENMTLFFIVVGERGIFREGENLTSHDNIFVSRTSSLLYGDILIGEGSTALLEDGELILKKDGECFRVSNCFSLTERKNAGSRKRYTLSSL